MIQERIEHLDNTFQEITDKINELDNMYQDYYSFYEILDNNSYNFNNTGYVLTDINWTTGIEVEMKVKFVDNLPAGPSNVNGGTRLFWVYIWNWLGWT